MRPTLKAPELVGTLLAAFGLALAARWLFEPQWVTEMILGSTRIGLVSPLLLATIGVALIGAARPLTARRRALVRACAVPLIGLPLGYLIEHATGIALGIDIARASVRAAVDNPVPGRISPNASLGFLAVGVALWLHGGPLSTLRRRLEIGCIVAVALVSVAAMVGYFLDLEYLYQIAHANRMLPATAAGQALAAAGLWMLRQQDALAGHDTGRASARTIQWRSFAVILLVALSAGVAGFAAMRETFEQSVAENALLTARSDAKAIANALDLSLRFARTTATRPAIVQALATLSSTPGDASASAWLRSTATTLLPLGAGGLQFHDAAGTLVAHAGTMVTSEPGAPRVPIDSPGQRAELVERQGLWLASDTAVLQDGRVIGHIVIELPLRFVDTVLADLRASNPSTDAVIFGRLGNRALLMASKDGAAGEVLLLDARALPAQPKFNALGGQSDVQLVRHADGVAVLSAYAPIGTLGLGFAVDTTLGSLYAPLRGRIAVLALALAAIVSIGGYALSNQVRPILGQLVASQQNLKAILEAQTELVSIAAPDGRLTYVNSAYARQFGRTPAEMVWRNLFDEIDPADRAAVHRLFESLVGSGVAHRGENRMQALDGREFWVSWVNTLQFDAEGRPTIHSVGRDITERRHAELALATAQAFLARTGRVAGVGGWEYDLATRQLTWSDMTRRLHEVPEGFVPTVDASIAFYAPDARPVIEAAAAQCSIDGTPWDLELPLVTASGRAIWVRAQGEAEFEGGVPRRVVGAIQDVTERRLLQQRLAENERFIRKITDSLPVRIAYVDPALRYAFVNQAHCHRFGRTREEIVGRTRSELTGAPLDPSVRQRLEAALAGTEQRYEFDERVGDRMLRIESRLMPDIDTDGTVRGVFATGIDITERSASERALRELALIFDNTPDFVVQTDHRGNIGYLNPSVRRALGLAADASVLGRSFAEFNTDETNRRFATEILPVVNTGGVWLGQTTVVVKDNPALPVSHMVIAHRDDHGRVTRYSAIMRDVSAAVQAAEQAQRQTATLHSISEAIPAIVAVVGADGRYRFVNGSFERWYGASREHIVGRSVMEVLGLKEYERSRPFIERALAGETVNFEKGYVDAAGDRHLGISYIPLKLDGGAVDGFVGVAQDISQQKREQLRLVKLSQHDSMTGLLNRAGFEQYLDEQQEQPQRNGQGQLALLYIDLDHFKPVNDTHGHAVGDQLLQAFAKRLHRIVRPSDAVARLGGDEFAVALIGVREAANAHAVAEKVLAAAAEPFLIGGNTLRIGASIGVAFGLEAGQGWRDLVQRADAHLYEAKAAGRGRFSGARQALQVGAGAQKR